MVSTLEKKNLSKLIIPSSSSSPNSSPSSPHVIHSRSHSFVGPSPRFAPCSTPLFFLDEEEEEEEEELPLGPDPPKIGPSDFHILRVLGQGAFGKVFLVRKKGDCFGDGDGVFAMKVMRKDTIIKKNHIDYMKAERDILTKVLHPFIVQLRYSFQTKSKLYLVLDFINGGHLFFQLYRQGIFSEDQARLYTAEIVSAVSHLHKNGIVHRDLKPENILMDADGHEMGRSGCHQFSLKNLAESLKTLGNKAMQSKKYSDAIELYNCAIAVHEKSAVYYCNRAAAYTQINKYTEAIQDCLRSIEIDPNYSKAYSRLGLVYYAQGNYRDAIHKGFRKALQLDPNNESVKENIRVAERKLLEEQHRAYHNQNSRSSQEFPNQSAQGGSRSHGVPPPFSSMPFNPHDIASMFMNITNPTNAQPQGSHSHQERQEDSNGSGAREPEIRIGGNISVNMEDMPEDITGALQSMMEMLSGAAPPVQPQDQTNGRTAPN